LQINRRGWRQTIVGVGSLSGGSAFVMVVQTTDFGNLDYFTVGARLYSSGLRGVFAQR
jgi:hypothetical protein